MSIPFQIQSSDDSLLDKATQVAHEFAQTYTTNDIVGIVFLGAIVRHYFDYAADIDIALFKKQTVELSLPSQFLKVEGFEVHCHVVDYERELTTPWDMAQRWTYAQGQIHYDPEGKIAHLLEEKVPLRLEEKKWLLMSGLTLSEWYINRLTQLWVDRGNITSAHHMFDEGLNHFFNLLFAYNNQLVADVKWRYYCVERLPLLPSNFQDRMRDTMTLQSFSREELERRRASFMDMWQEMLPVVEREVQMSYEQIIQLV
jgi:hypothetical protein